MKEEAVTEEKLRSSTSQDYTMTENVHSQREPLNRAGFKGHCHLGKFTLHQANTHLCKPSATGEMLVSSHLAINQLEVTRALFACNHMIGGYPQ